MPTKRKPTKVVIKPFSRLNKAEKRIAIAEDVLAQIKLGTILAQKGTYLQANANSNCSLSYSKLKNQQLNSLMQTNQVEYTCCGIGSLFVAKINKTNHLKFGEVGTNDLATSIHDKLKSIFTGNQLNLIEAAFETEVINDNNNELESYGEYGCYNTKLAEKAIKFGEKYESDKDRLIGIMKNIIKNQGEFKP